MKKVLSFVLVLAMILGSASMAFAAPYKNVAPTKDNTVLPFEDAKDNEAATVLRDLGVLTGANGKAYLDETITRAEFCAMIVRALGLEEVAKSKAETKFTDVPKNEWYSGYVAVAVANGVVNGTTATTFEPDAEVSADEAIAFVVKALGYDQAHLQGTWPVNFRMQANDLGIVPVGYEYDVDAATREAVFTVLYKALDKQIVEWNAKWDQFQAVNGASTNATMNRRLGATSNAAIIYTTVEETLTGGETFINGFDATEFAGQTVKVLYKNGQRIGIAGSASDALVGQFTSTTAFKLEDGTTYVVTASATSLTPQVVYLNGTSAGVSPTVPTGTALTSVVVEKNAKGEIATLCSVTYELKTAVIAITSAGLAAKVANPASAAAVIPGLVSGSAEKAEYLNVKLEGVKAIDEIAEDDIVEVYYVGDNSVNNVYKLVVVRDKVAGAVTAIGTKTPVLYTIGGKDYEEAAITAAGIALPGKDVVKAGTPYALYLDSEGKIAYAGFADKTPAAAPATSTVAFALTGAATTVTNVFTEKKGWTSTASVTIDLIVPGETEAKTYVLTGSATSTTLKTASLCAFELNAKGEIATIDAVTYTEASDAYVDKYGYDKYLLADDAVVVIANGRVTTSAAYYAPKTAADIKNATWASFTYKIDDKTSKVAFVFAKAAAATSTPVQKYAYITDVKTVVGGTGASIVVIGGEAKTYIATDNAATLDMTANVVASIYAVTLSGANITDAVATDAAATIATTAGVKIENNQVKSTGETYAIEDGTVILAEKDGVLVAVEDVAAALKAGKTVELYNLVPDEGINTWYDVVIIR